MSYGGTPAGEYLYVARRSNGARYIEAEKHDISMTWRQYRRHYCTFDGREVRMTEREAELLSTLLIRRGEVLHAFELVEALYPGDDDEPDARIINVWICKLRRMMPGLIRTVWGRGYIIDQPEHALRPAGPLYTEDERRLMAALAA